MHVETTGGTQTHRRPGSGASGMLRAVSAAAGQIALSEVIGGLSYALDLTEGEPPGHAVRSCLIGMRLAEEIGLDADVRSHLFLRVRRRHRCEVALDLPPLRPHVRDRARPGRGA